MRTTGRALVLAFTLCAACAGTANAQLTLDSRQVNVFNSGAPADTERTWFGYVTNPTPFAGSQGDVSPIVPATGPAVTKLAPRGLDQVHTYSHTATLSALNLQARTGTAQFSGGIKFFSPGPPPAAGHDFTITIENPRIVLTGNTGQLYGSGTGSGGAYNDTQPIYNLDLSKARFSTESDGTQILSCISPSVATANLVYPEANYPAGHGPNRTPNTFGSFTLRDGAIDSYPSCATTPTTPTTPAQPSNPGGTTKPGTTKSKRKSRKLRLQFKRVLFSSRRRSVTLRTPRKRLLGTGVAHGRNLRINLRTSTTLKGRYVLRLKNRRRGEPFALTIRIG